jgi:hypothetical protein
MAVPTLVEEAISGANTAADTNLPLTFASIPADDDLIILEYSQSDPTPATRTWPTGFTEFLSYSAGSGADIHCAWKLASGEGSATYDIDLGDAGDANQNLRGQVWTGVDQTTPINVVGTGKDIDFVNEAESFTVNGVTTTVNDCALVIVTADEGNDCTGITSTGFTQLEHDGTPDSNRFLQIMHGSKAAAGATGDITCQAQFGFLSDASTAMFAIAPPTVADPPGASTGPGIVIGSSSSFIGEGAIGAPDSSGTTTPQSLNVTATITPTMLRTVNKLVNVTASTTRTIVRTVAKAITVTGALTPAIVKSVNKPFAVTATLTATLAAFRQYLKTISATATGTATMARQAGKLVSVTATGTPTIVRSIAHAIAVTATLAPTMRRQTAKAIAVTSSLTPTMVRQVGKLLAVTSSTTSTIRRTTNKAIAVTSTLTATLIATFVPAPGGTTFPQVLNVTSTLSASMSRAVTYARTLAATSTLTPTITRATSKTVATVATLAATLRKSVNKTVTASATLTATMARLRSVVAVLNVTATSTATIQRQIAKSLTANATLAPTVAKGIGKTLGQIVSLVASLVATFQTGATTPRIALLEGSPLLPATLEGSPGVAFLEASPLAVNVLDGSPALSFADGSPAVALLEAAP